jgi:ketosteroid isomerase-like protein
MTRFLLLSLLAFALAACQTPTTDTTSATTETPTRTVADLDADRAELAAMTASYEAAARAGDHTTIGALHADDAILQPANEPAVSGRAELDAYFEANDSEPRDISFTTIYIGVADSGDLAYEVGESTGAGSQGKYLTVYRRTPDGWKIVADAWNYDAPQTASD